MSSITLLCHPAQLYYFYTDHPDKLTGTRINGVPIEAERDVLLLFAKATVDAMSSAVSLAGNPGSLEFIVESHDEELLCWIKLAGPHPGTPPRDD